MTQANSTRWLRIAIGMYVASLVALIASYFAVSTRQVPVSAYVQGPMIFEAGAPHALRATILDAQLGARRRDVATLEWFLVSPGAPVRTETSRAEPLRTVLADRSGMTHLTLTPGRDEAPGARELVLRVVFKDPEAEVFEARGAVEVLAATEDEVGPWPEMTSRRDSEQERRGERYGMYTSRGPVRIDIVPPKPELVRGLPNRVYLRVSDRATGAPLACTITFDERRGHTESPLPAEVRSSAMGFAELELTPLLDQSWTLSTTCSPPTLRPDAQESAQAPQETSRSSMILTTVAAQTSMSKVPATATGARIEGAVQSLYETGSLFVDAYDGERWFAANAYGLGPRESGWRVEAHEQDEQVRVVRVQVYTDFYMQSRAWDAHHVAVTSEGASRRDVAVALVARHAATESTFPDEHPGQVYQYMEEHALDGFEEMSVSDQNMAIRALLRAIPARFVAPPVVIHSLPKDEAILAEWREAARGKLILLIAGAMGLGMVILSLVVVRGLQSLRARDRLYAEVELELACGEADDAFDKQAVARASIMGQWMAAVQIAVVLGTLLLFIGCMIMLLGFM
ncbi:MAG: hypothetical protein AAGI01_01170 [Myxococcota bacterium]